MKAEKLQKLSAEQRLLILTCRLTFSSEEKDEIKHIIKNKNINWFEFYKLAFYHKTATLCWKNINDICPSVKIPKYLFDSIAYIYNCTEVCNKANQKELNSFLEECLKKNITCVPVKGAYLIPNMYCDHGLRYSGDIDFLIKYEDVATLKEILHKFGYVCGTYNRYSKKIDAITRPEEIRWKLYMSNLHPYYKLSENSVFPFYKLDFRFSLDDSRDKQAVNEIVNGIKENSKFTNAYYFIHLCTHFYGEAKRSASIVAAKDMNLIKLCDIREFVLKYLKKSDFSKICDFATKYSIKEAVYFTLYCLSEIYNDSYEKEFMSDLGIEDESFINRYGENTESIDKIFNSSLLERFFLCGNEGELEEIPLLFKTIK